MLVTIDRFEGEFAVVETEDRHMVNMPRCLLPTAHEGDIIRITVEKDITQQTKKHIKTLTDELFID